MRIRVPVWFGNAVLLGATLLGVVAVRAADPGRDGRRARPGVRRARLVGRAALARALARGTDDRDRVTCYFLRPMPPFPRIKIDYRSYLLASPEGRAWMHASGAIASKLGPLVALPFWPASVAPA